MSNPDEHPPEAAGSTPSQPRAPAQPGLFAWNRTAWLLIALLAIVIAALFSNVRNLGFIDYDDDVYVFANPRVRGGLTAENVKWAWTQSSHAGYWIPMTWMSLQIDGALSGNAEPPPIATQTRISGAPPPLPGATVYHLHNLALHIVCAALLFVFLYRATGFRTTAFVITLFWAIHPLRVESVAWVSERKDVLAGTFGFLAMVLYLQWLAARRWWWYAAMGVSFACSLMCKASFITLPFILVLVDAWPLNRIRNQADILRRLGEKWLLLAMTLVASVAVLLAQAQSGAVRSLADVTFASRLQNAIVAYVTYLQRQFRVWDLAVLYPYRPPPAAAIVAACALLLAAITVLCIRQMRRRPWLLIGWLWYLGAMFPWIGLIQSGPQAYADRLTYLPVIGLLIMVFFTGRELWQHRPALRPLLGGGAAIAGIFFAVFTWIQIGYWKDSITIGERAVAVTEKNLVMHGNLAIAYLRQGENQKAEQHYKAALEIAPDFPRTWMQLGALYLQLGQYEAAYRTLGKAARLDPRNPQAHFLHGVALERAGHPDGAALEYENTLRLNPNHPQAAQFRERAQRADAQRRAPQPPATQSPR